MVFPNDSTPLISSMQGTTLLADATDDHALQHRQLGTVINAVTSKIGLPAGTPAANQVLVGSGVGTATWGSVWNSAQLGTPTITGGTYNSAVLGTPTIDLINARNAGTAVLFGNSIAPSEGSVADSAGGTLTVDARASQIYYSVLGTAAGNRTIGTPTNPTNYQLLTYAFKASGSANGTLVWSGVFRFNTGGTLVLGTAVTWNYYGWRYNAIDSKWDFMGASQF